MSKLDLIPSGLSVIMRALMVDSSFPARAGAGRRRKKGNLNVISDAGVAVVSANAGLRSAMLLQNTLRAALLKIGRKPSF